LKADEAFLSNKEGELKWTHFKTQLIFWTKQKWSYR
jgi:hypothetical protein